MFQCTTQSCYPQAQSSTADLCHLLILYNWNSVHTKQQFPISLSPSPWHILTSVLTSMPFLTFYNSTCLSDPLLLFSLLHETVSSLRTGMTCLLFHCKRHNPSYSWCMAQAWHTEELYQYLLDESMKKQTPQPSTYDISFNLHSCSVMVLLFHF